jgi:uncharacterized protein (DUF488 family)
MTTFSIGFTKTDAASFFGRLREASVRTVWDVRLQNTSQLAGFAKLPDLEFFLAEICGIGYRHEPGLAPSPDLFADYRKHGLKWDAFEQRFLDLMAERRIEDKVSADELAGACLLCSEDKPHRCHRRLVLEYLESCWGKKLDVRHL